MTLHKMAPVDAAWFHMDGPANLAMVTSVALTKKSLEVAKVKALYTARLSAYPRFRQRVVERGLPLAVPHWEDMPHFDMGGRIYKVPTGWLIEQCGLKGKLLHGIRVNPANALVLINESARGYSDLAQAREAISKEVSEKFHIHIEQEPLELA